MAIKTGAGGGVGGGEASPKRFHSRCWSPLTTSLPESVSSQAVGQQCHLVAALNTAQEPVGPRSRSPSTKSSLSSSVCVCGEGGHMATWDQTLVSTRWRNSETRCSFSKTLVWNFNQY